MRILIAWELGDNFGHIFRQLPIAKALRIRGHDVLFVVKDVAIAQQILQDARFSFVQAPVPRRKIRLNREIASFADILAYHGFAEENILSSLIYAWQHVYRLYQPDVVIVDHAPAALFAARLLNVPTSEIGMGFELPPRVSPYPCFRPWLNLPENTLRVSEEAILDNLNKLCRDQQQTELLRLSDVMVSDVQLLVTFPEIDHYSQRKHARYLGPLFTLSDGLVVEWPTGHVKNIFVYIRPGEALTSILSILSQTEANILCVVPGINPDLKKKFATATFQIYSTYLRLEPLLKKCNLAITYSGHGTIAACLLAGIPMLVVPTQIEQLMLANCLKRSGMGLGVQLSAVPTKFASALNDLLSNPIYTIRARALAEKYKSYDQKKIVERIANTIERLPAFHKEKAQRRRRLANYH